MPKKKKKVKYIIYLCISESSTSIHPTLQTGQPGRFSDFLLFIFFLLVKLEKVCNVFCGQDLDFYQEDGLS